MGIFISVEGEDWQCFFHKDKASAVSLSSYITFFEIRERKEGLHELNDDLIDDNINEAAPSVTHYHKVYGNLWERMTKLRQVRYLLCTRDASGMPNPTPDTGYMFRTAGPLGHSDISRGEARRRVREREFREIEVRLKIQLDHKTLRSVGSIKRRQFRIQALHLLCLLLLLVRFVQCNHRSSYVLVRRGCHRLHICLVLLLVLAATPYYQAGKLPVRTVLPGLPMTKAHSCASKTTILKVRMISLGLTLTNCSNQTSA